jgi:hypothetical protein
MAGAIGITGEHTKCLNDGGDCCEYRMEWQEVLAPAL